MMHTFLFKMYLITLIYPIFILLPYVGAYYLQLYECIACSDVKTGLKKDYEICHELLPEMFRHKLCDCAKRKNVEYKKGSCWLNSCIERKLIYEIMICSEMDKLSETMNKIDKRKYTQFLECLFRAKKKFCELKKPYYPCATLC